MGFALKHGLGVILVVVYELDPQSPSSVDLTEKREHLPIELRSMLDPHGSASAWGVELVALGRRSDEAQEMAQAILQGAGLAVQKYGLDVNKLQRINQ